MMIVTPIKIAMSDFTHCYLTLKAAYFHLKMNEIWFFLFLEIGRAQCEYFIVLAYIRIFRYLDYIWVLRYFCSLKYQRRFWYFASIVCSNLSYNFRALAWFWSFNQVALIVTHGGAWVARPWNEFISFILIKVSLYVWEDLMKGIAWSFLFYLKDGLFCVLSINLWEASYISYNILKRNFKR